MEMHVYIIKTFIINLYTLYVFKRVLNLKGTSKSLKGLLFGTSIAVTLLATYVEYNINTFISGIIPYLIYGVILSLLIRREMGFTIIVTILSYAITLISYGIGVVIQFIPYKLLDELLGIDNRYISLLIILFIQFWLLYGFFNIKRFKNGFSFL